MADKREDVEFKDAQEEYAYHLIRAEYHIRRALAQVGTTRGPNRGALCKALLRRAHGIILGLYVQESRTGRKK